jgi:hypothetical protein
MKALIDGDIILYEIGYAADGASYTVKHKGVSVEFGGKREANEYCERLSIPTDIIKKTLNPVEDWLVRKMVDNLISSITTTISTSLSRPTSPVVYISGPTNFRTTLATRAVYKGNRDKDKKPHHYEYIKEYLKEEYRAIVSKGVEADDMLGLAIDDESVLCSRDKDLLMVPGWHFNWKGEGVFNISGEDALKHFHCQCLTGDKVDNIIGLERVGPATAAKILKPATTIKGQWEIVKQEYDERLADGRAALEENGMLLWIQQRELKDWSLDNYQDFLSTFY